jgi:hypothetical protein
MMTRRILGLWKPYPRRGIDHRAVHFQEPALLSETLDTEKEQDPAAEPAEPPLAGSDIPLATLAS